MKLQPLLRIALPILIALSLGLTACNSSTPAGPPKATYSPDDAAAAITGIQTDTNGVASGSMNSDAGLAVQALPSSLPAPAAAGQLPTGIYQWNASTEAWDPVGASGNLVLQWTFPDDTSALHDAAVSHDAVLTLDWSVNSSTVVVNVDGSTQEVPQDALATLTVDGTEVGRLAAQIGWQDTPACGLILEPATLSLSGYLGTTDHKVSIDKLTLSIPLANGTLATTGKVSGVNGSDTVSFDWDLSFVGSVTRDALTCGLTDASVTSGHIALGITSNDHDMHVAFDVGNLTFDSSGELQSVDISNGSFTIDGAVAVTFEGTISNATIDTIPGDDLILTFAGGQTMSLKDFLQGHLGATSALMALGRLHQLHLPFPRH